MKQRLAPALCLIAATALWMGCEVRNISSPSSPTPLNQTPPSNSGGDAPAVSLAGQWVSASGGGGGAAASPAAAVANLSSCDNFKLSVTSQTGNTATGSFSVVCLGTYQIAGTATGTLHSSTSARIELDASASVPGTGPCQVTVSSDATLEGDIIRLPFTAQTCLGTFTGTETLRKSSLFPTPEPPIVEPPYIEPPITEPPVSTPADAIDLSSATIVLGPPNVASWPQTSEITSVRASNGELCINHTSLGRWPTIPFFDTPAHIEGNQWVFANIGGRWYGGAGEWVRPGQECKLVDAPSIGRDAFAAPHMEPLRSWVPRYGEIFAVMATTPARAWPGMQTINVRSNVVFVRWEH